MFEAYIMGVEADVNYIFIVFDRILENRFEIFVIPEGLTITFLFCWVDRTLIKRFVVFSISLVSVASEVTIVIIFPLIVE